MHLQLLENLDQNLFRKGNILGSQRVMLLVQHEGIINFTIGQRKGIGIAHSEPLYVVNIDARKNEVIVGNKKDLSIKKIYLRDLNLLDKVELYNENLFIKVRSTGRLIQSKVVSYQDKIEVILSEIETGISPGQACVFYSKNKVGDKVLGGGWITKTDNNYLST